MAKDGTNRGGRAQAAVTSPPYGVGKEYEKAGIEPNSVYSVNCLLTDEGIFE